MRIAIKPTSSQTWLSLGLGLVIGLWLSEAGSYSSSTVSPVNDMAQQFTAEQYSEQQLAQHLEQLLADTPQRLQQRQLYQQAEQAFRLRRYGQFRQLLGSLHDYPLHPYLQYQDLKRNLGGLNQQQIDDFLERNQNSLIADRLRRKLISHYAKRQQWQALIDIYQPQGSTRLQCHYLRALINTGRKSEAFGQIIPLWLAGKSQPKSCDPAFKAWEQAGFRTDQITWQRIELAMAKGKTQLASHLAKTLNTSDRRMVKLWTRVHHNPRLANRVDFNQHPETTNILVHAIKRMTRKSPQKGISLWQQLSEKYYFPQQDSYKVYRVIGLKMARRHQPDANLWLTLIPANMSDETVLEWRVRSAIRQANWHQTIAAIENMPPKKQAAMRWQFWWAYANEQLGKSIDAESTYRYLAGRRSYYGFLAADRLELPYAFENKPLKLNQEELLDMLQQPIAQRARELFKLNKINDARREWYQLIGSLNEDDKLTASKLAQHWGWHDRAILTMGKTDYRDDIVLRFPLPLRDEIEAYSQLRSIDTAWTYAIIRRESAFMADARSPVGALGLMQIRPSTARSVARNMKVRYRGRHSLLKTDTNIKLGTGYLEQMLDHLDSQPVLATAAYNAGPHRVKAWLPEYQSMEAIRWIETIPFTETREYVSSVLAYTVIYQHLIHQQYTRLSNKMPPVPARNPASQAAELRNRPLFEKS